MKLCPYCEQDDLWIVVIEGIPRPDAVMCCECETVWNRDETIEYGTGKNFHNFMAALDKEANWKQVTRKQKFESQTAG
ncbi:MAG: hypothetical protein ABI614_29525 [Planctomycetota bacterium]